MKITTPSSTLSLVINLTQFALWICSFFWFGWRIALFILILTIRIDNK